MYCASDYRSMARRALKNFWWLAVGVTLLATVLGGGTSSFTVSFQNSDVSRYYPEAMRRFTHVLVPVASVLAMGQFVLRGSISIGHDRFCLKLVDGEQAQFEDLFSAFDIFGSAFVLNLLIALKVFAWSLLFVIPGIIAAYRYSMATYIMAENPTIAPTEAIERSKALMDGRQGRSVLSGSELFRLGTADGADRGIGALWLTPYMAVSRAAFYRSLPRSMGDRAPNGWQPQPGDRADSGRYL